MAALAGRVAKLERGQPEGLPGSIEVDIMGACPVADAKRRGWEVLEARGGYVRRVRLTPAQHAASVALAHVWIRDTDPEGLPRWSVSASEWWREAA